MIIQKDEYYPDVFLAGAPKSGTTFLFNVLSHHPSICPSDPKETDYFLDTDNPNRKKAREGPPEEYLAYYNSSCNGRIHLDGSVWTIYQTQLIDRLSLLSKKPKVILILREPAARIFSSFQFTSNNLSAVKDLSFSEYVDFLLNSEEEKIANMCKNQNAAYSLQNELNFSNYQLYLKKWKEAIGIENMKLSLYEDLKDDPDTFLTEVCQFLGIGSNFEYGSFEKANVSVEIKNKSINYLMRKVYAFTGYKIPFKKSLKNIYAKLQYVDHQQKSYPMEDLKRLKEYYKEHNENLASEFNLDLSAWR